PVGGDPHLPLDLDGGGIGGVEAVAGLVCAVVPGAGGAVLPGPHQDVRVPAAPGLVDGKADDLVEVRGLGEGVRCVSAGAGPCLDLHEVREVGAHGVAGVQAGLLDDPPELARVRGGGVRVLVPAFLVVAVQVVPSG